MSTKIVKRESVKFGEYDVALADVVRVAQEDGNGTGYTVGLVASKAGRDKYALLPFARVLELNHIDNMRSAVFNDYTRVWKDERKASEAVRKLCERFLISEGERARELLSIEEEERKTERVKKSTSEKVTAALKTAKGKGAYLDIANVTWVELMSAVDSLAVSNMEAARAVVDEMKKYIAGFDEKHPVPQK